MTEIFYILFYVLSLQTPVWTATTKHTSVWSTHLWLPYWARAELDLTRHPDMTNLTSQIQITKNILGGVGWRIGSFSCYQTFFFEIFFVLRWLYERMTGKTETLNVSWVSPLCQALIRIFPGRRASPQRAHHLKGGSDNCQLREECAQMWRNTKNNNSYPWTLTFQGTKIKFKSSDTWKLLIN